MKILVLGASGKTGTHVWQQALEEGHEVSVFVRTASKLEAVKDKVNIISGDVFSADSVAAAITGHDAFIICLGSSGLRDTSTLTTGTRNVITAMNQNNVPRLRPRLIVLSAAGVGESWQQIGWMSRLLFKTMLKNVFNDHIAQEALVKLANLNWTIVRAAVLTDKPASGEYRADNTTKTGKIARADVADFLVKQVTDKRYLRQAISVSS